MNNQTPELKLWHTEQVLDEAVAEILRLEKKIRMLKQCPCAKQRLEKLDDGNKRIL